MRTAAFTLICFVALGYAANSQRLSLLPQVGFENSKVNLNYNDLRSFSPIGVKFSPQASLRLNYAPKSGHGFFLGLASSRSTVSFSFADPETGMNNFISTANNMQLRLEGGYQFNSKPISLSGSKQASSKQKSAGSAKKKNCGTSTARSSCSKDYASSSRCSGKSNKQKQQKQPLLSKSKGGSWVRLQPSVGLGYIPFTKSNVTTKGQGTQTVYEYRAGNWNTAVTAGAGFEFGRKDTRLFTVSINYFKGLGKNEETITANNGVKTTTTNLQSVASGWNMRVGIPFTLKAKKPTAKKDRKPNCGQYRTIYRCNSR